MTGAYYLKSGLICISMLAMSACTTLVTKSNAALSGSISNDAINLNEAFNQATNAVLLKNVLRARDRWPTNYTTLSGIKSSPTLAQSNGLTLSPLGLGNPNGTDSKSSPGQTSNTVISQAIGSANEYNVNPFASTDRSESLLTPIKENVFERYYDSWPKDVVMLMFVSNISADGKLISKDDPNKKAPEVTLNFHNSGDEFHDVLRKLKAALFLSDSELKEFVEGDETTNIINILSGKLDIKSDLILAESNANSDANTNRGCAEKRITQNDIISVEETFISNLEKFKEITKADISLKKDNYKVSNSDLTLKICEAKKTASKVFKLSPTALKQINRTRKDKQLSAIKARDLRFTLRSFEDIVYYLGETLRVEDKSNDKTKDKPNKKPVVNTFCSRETNQVPIFKIANANSPEENYAVSVRHVDHIVYAMPKATDKDGLAKCQKERTATAMSILNQLLILNQSPEFLKAPENFFNR